MPHSRLFTFLCALAIFTFLRTSILHADWPQFRGVNAAGIADEGSLPIEFGPDKNELWSVEVPAGHSSPVIVGIRIFLTSYSRDPNRLSVLCLDRKDGNLIWQQDLHPETLEKGHPSFNPASSTVACDGELVVAYFGSYGLACFDVKGNKQWEIRMPLTKSYAGNATSPIIHKNKVILYRGNLVDHFLLAVDKRSGEELWKVPQNEPFEFELACTAVPIVVGNKLIVHSARSVQAFEIETGKQIWETKCATTATSSPVLHGDQVVVAAWNKMGEPSLRPKFPSFEDLVAKHDQDSDALIAEDELPLMWIFHRPDGAEAPQNGAKVRFRSVDKDKNGMIDGSEWTKKLGELAAFRSSYKTHGILSIPVDSHGLLTGNEVQSLATRNIPEVPSPIANGGYLYFVKNGGVLSVLNLESGKVTSRVRTRGEGTHYASPIIADGKLFSTSGDGTISVLSLGGKPKVLQVNSMGERCYSTPACSDGVLYVRTHQRLYAFGLAASLPKQAHCPN
ncbi:MAG: PQQ-binding-like beta-propeller repeat protein [Planctomycetota bacterium]|nr:PQQ-binding-like beta-propeller repeat protein [Planctomycetota bacterium]